MYMLCIFGLFDFLWSNHAFPTSVILFVDTGYHSVITYIYKREELSNKFCVWVMSLLIFIILVTAASC